MPSAVSGTVQLYYAAFPGRPACFLSAGHRNPSTICNIWHILYGIAVQPGWMLVDMGMKKADPQFCRTGFSGILFEGNSAIVNGADVSCRVLPNPIDTHFEVTMVSVSITGGADCCNQLTLFYPFANLDINLAVVCVEGLNSAAMVNNYISAIGAVGVVEGRYNGT